MIKIDDKGITIHGSRVEVNLELGRLMEALVSNEMTSIELLKTWVDVADDMANNDSKNVPELLLRGIEGFINLAESATNDDDEDDDTPVDKASENLARNIMKDIFGKGGI